MKIGFLGAGSWGTALAVTVAKNGHDVMLWSAIEDELNILRTHREHTERLPGVKLPDNVYIEGDLKKACEDKDLIVFSVASPYVRSVAEQAKDYIPEGQKIVNVGKGIEDGTIHVFDTSKFTVGGKTLEELVESGDKDATKLKDYIKDGYFHESDVESGMPSAPAFTFIIDGINSITK